MMAELAEWWRRRTQIMGSRVMGGRKKFAVVFWRFLLFLEKRTCNFAFVSYVTEEVGRKYVQDMPWPLAAECNMITNKQTCMLIDTVDVMPSRNA
jgi:hypothetical protein